ncbi:hypothetical protein CEXT_452241 [Caerostris extrusa]|uniref:Uncharacterized protein n=1 Tax=Caerostris extrusa TaxID=172846 RepID=A0AAV4WSQ0_CAEEX|nr:hypothetical protein CEXT_452241 [Caerostris extrusa]
MKPSQICRQERPPTHNKNDNCCSTLPRVIQNTYRPPLFPNPRCFCRIPSSSSEGGGEACVERTRVSRAVAACRLRLSR